MSRPSAEDVRRFEAEGLARMSDSDLKKTYGDSKRDPKYNDKNWPSTRKKQVDKYNSDMTAIHKKDGVNQGATPWKHAI